MTAPALPAGQICTSAIRLAGRRPPLPCAGQAVGQQRTLPYGDERAEARCERPSACGPPPTCKRHASQCVSQDQRTRHDRPGPHPPGCESRPWRRKGTPGEALSPSATPWAPRPAEAAGPGPSCGAFLDGGRDRCLRQRGARRRRGRRYRRGGDEAIAPGPQGVDDGGEGGHDVGGVARAVVHQDDVPGPLAGPGRRWSRPGARRESAVSMSQYRTCMPAALATAMI